MNLKVMLYFELAFVIGVYGAYIVNGMNCTKLRKYVG